MRTLLGQGEYRRRAGTQGFTVSYSGAHLDSRCCFKSWLSRQRCAGGQDSAVLGVSPVRLTMRSQPHGHELDCAPKSVGIRRSACRPRRACPPARSRAGRRGAAGCRARGRRCANRPREGRGVDVCYQDFAPTCPPTHVFAPRIMSFSRLCPVELASTARSSAREAES
jgi:hypothetical protein